MGARIARAGLWVGLLCASAVSAGESDVRYPYRVEGVCPFECCQYGSWTARSDIPVSSAERARVAPAFTIKKGETFEAVGGAYWTLAPFILKTKAAVEIQVSSNLVPEAADRAKLGGDWTTNERMSLPAGTEIHVLANLGEGEQAGLAAGKPVALHMEMYEPGSTEFEVVRPRAQTGATEWWIEVQAGGRRGWFERGKHEIEGSDACE
jgi:hypothetical protein